MRPSITLQVARSQRRSLFVWSIALAALIALYMAVWPSVKGTGSSFTKLIEDMPAAYKALFTSGSGIDFSTPAGYLNVELFSFMAPIVVLVYAIGAGAAGIAGEEDHHTLDLLLVNTVSRRRIVVEKLAALVLGVFALTAAMWVALVLEARIAGMDLSAINSAAILVHLGLLGIEFGTLALAVGCWTGRLGLSRAVAAIAAAGTYVMNGLGTLVAWMKVLRPISPFYQYSGHDPLRTGLSGLGIAIAIASIAALVMLAVWAFQRRDVGT